jgi:predicted outer membrane repeat protein
LAFEPLEDRRLLSTVTVDTLIDVNASDGLTTLREAIAAAMPNDTIDFSVTGTINLSSLGQLTINKNLTITGPGANLLTVRAFDPSGTVGDGTHVFNIDDGNFTADKTVAISGLTLTGADVTASGNFTGGAIQSFENLSITACTISGNRVTGGSGGGIWQLGGNLTISSSTISGNTSTRGGGFYAFDVNVVVSDSTISGNTSTFLFGNGGGGIANSGGSVTVTNSTISGNSANANGGGIHVAGGSVTVRHSTITGNRADADNSSAGLGGGVFVSYGTASLDHTIVAGNFRSVSTRDDAGGALAARYSLIGDNTGATITNNGVNQIGTGASPIDPLLGSLANNGGPTFTHALFVGSPAIDTGDPAAAAGSGTVPLTDQRGAPFDRVFDGDAAGGARIDIGAYELQLLSLIVDTLSDENDGNFSAGDFSLREAIGLANSSSSADTITFAAALTSGGPATILLTQGELAITDAVTINGPGANLLTISGNNASRIFNTSSAPAGRAIMLQGLTLTSGKSTSRGGAIFVGDEALTLQSSTLSGNTATNSGGAITVGTGGSLVIEDSTLSGNTTTSTSVVSGHGGAIYIYVSSNLTIRRCTFSANTATGFGGAIDSRGSLTIEDSTLSGNTSNTTNGFGAGGAIFFQGNGTNFLLSNSTLSGNSALNVHGGAICWQGSSGIASIRNSTITNNAANASGGGMISLGSGTFSLNSTIVAGNSATNSPDLHLSSSGNIAGNNNLIGVADVGNFTLTGTGNQTGTKTSPLDANLGALTNNGGPTLTHLPLRGSPAINKGNNAAGLTFDQRGSGFPRLRYGAADVGAVEFFGPLPLALATAADVIFAGGTVHTITVQYFDDVGINTAALGNSDITVSGPGGPIPVTFSGFAGGGTSVTATYLMVPPGGSWDSGDDSTYSITMNANEVFDTDAMPNSVPAGTIGSFSVLIPFDPIVSITADENDGNFAANDVSLREAIFLANSFGGNQTITFDPTVFGTAQTITLQSSLGELSISDPLSIVGPTARLTVDAGGAIRHFQISAGNVSVSNVKLVNGSSQGGDGGSTLILTAGSVSFSNVAFVNNTATNSTTVGSGGAIAALSGGTLALTDCTFAGNEASSQGGALSATGTVTIRGSTFMNNSAARGGGIHTLNNVTFLMENSTVSGNTATETTFSGRGGGIGFFGFAAAGGSITIRNSTITNNTAMGFSGGGIHITPTSTNPILIESTIIAGNFHPDNTDPLYIFSPDLYGPNSTDTSGAWNLTVNNSLVGILETPMDFTSASGNITGTEAAPVDAMLGPLADNGGPTMTQALLPGSPAIDAGDPAAAPGVGTVPLFDQRGNNFGRVQNGRIDIGAFEVPSTASADFDSDGFITGLDFLLWQIGVGTPAPDALKTDGDADNDLDADGSDLGVWELQYGGPAPLVASASVPVSTGSLSAPSPARNDLADLVLAVHLADKLRLATDDAELVTPSPTYSDYFSSDPINSSGIATTFSHFDQESSSTALATQERSADELSPWEDALDEAFASVFA